MKKYVPQTSRAFLAWTPDPKGGIQLLKAGRYQWWVFKGDKAAGYLDAMCNGRWAVCMWDFLCRGKRSPQRTKLEDAARLAVRFTKGGQ